MSDNVTRRDFLSQSTRTAAGVTAVSVLAGSRAEAAAGERIRLGIIGCGGIMNYHVSGLVERKSPVTFSYLCDIDPRQIDKIAKHIDQRPAPKRTGRYEDVLDDPNVDAVIIATPHHWHVPIALAAMQAGKDVYVEKPLSHVFSEGKLMIDAAKRSGRVMQHGSQMRSSPVTVKAGRLLDAGIIGEVKVARAWTAETRNVMKPVADGTPPQGVDYDRWLGPAAKRPFNTHRFHRTWRQFRDYGNGEIGDDGIHDLDMACWGLGVESMPRQVTSRGGRMILHGHDSDYPDNMIATYEYPDGKLLIYENYPFTSYGLHGFDNGNVFYGTEGYMIFSRRGAFSVFLGPKAKPGPTEGKEIRGSRGYAEHMDNFFDCIRTRKPTNSTPEIANRSCALVHFGDIAFRTKGRLEFDLDKEQFVDCDEANRLLTKKYRAPYGISGSDT